MNLKHKVITLLSLFGLNNVVMAQTVYLGNANNSQNTSFEGNLSQIKENGINPVGGVYIQQPNVSKEQNSKINNIIKPNGLNNEQPKTNENKAVNESLDYQKNEQRDIEEIAAVIKKRESLNNMESEMTKDSAYRVSNIKEWNNSTIIDIESKAKINDGTKYQQFILKSFNGRN